MPVETRTSNNRSHIEGSLWGLPPDVKALGYVSLSRGERVRVLSPRQHEALVYGSLGYDAEEMADAMLIERYSAAKLRTRTLQSLGAKNMSHAARLGFETGLLGSDGVQFEGDLTEQECYYLNLVSHGVNGRELLDAAGLDKKSSEKFRREIFEKFDTDKMPYVIRVCFQSGILRPDSPTAQSEFTAYQ